MSGRVDSTDLKERLLAKCSRSLAFNDEVATALQQACECDFDNVAMTPLKATRIIRRDMLYTKSKFNSTFKNSFQQESENINWNDFDGDQISRPSQAIGPPCTALCNCTGL